MEIVKNNPEIKQEQIELTQAEYYKAICNDFQAGEITFEKIEEKLITIKVPIGNVLAVDDNEDDIVYEEKEVLIKTEPGKVQYWIEYIKSERYLYRGGYHITPEIEAKYIASGKLVNYLLYQLSIQMSKLI
jgi:hypothetical protein